MISACLCKYNLANSDRLTSLNYKIRGGFKKKKTLYLGFWPKLIWPPAPLWVWAPLAGGNFFWDSCSIGPERCFKINMSFFSLEPPPNWYWIHITTFPCALGDQWSLVKPWGIELKPYLAAKASTLLFMVQSLSYSLTLSDWKQNFLVVSQL